MIRSTPILTLTDIHFPSPTGVRAGVGDGSAGKAEVFSFSHQGKTLISLASEHTDRKLEAHSVALSKQLCAKPVARTAWIYDDVAAYWDELILRAWIEEDGGRVLYQEGPLALLQHPMELIEGHFGQRALPDPADRQSTRLKSSH